MYSYRAAKAAAERFQAKPDASQMSDSSFGDVRTPSAVRASSVVRTPSAKFSFVVRQIITRLKFRLDADDKNATRNNGFRMVGLWVVILVLSALLPSPMALHRAALFLHLVSLCTGFGAVIVADVHGALWLLGRRKLEDLVRLTQVLHPVIWTGLAGLCVSGIFLSPNFSLLRTSIKMVLVLVVALNGLWLTKLNERLGDLPAGAVAETVSRDLLTRVVVAGVISQTAWWGALLIGFLNSSA